MAYSTPSPSPYLRPTRAPIDIKDWYQHRGPRKAIAAGPSSAQFVATQPVLRDQAPITKSGGSYTVQALRSPPQIPGYVAEPSVWPQLKPRPLPQLRLDIPVPKGQVQPVRVHGSIGRHGSVLCAEEGGLSLTRTCSGIRRRLSMGSRRRSRDGGSSKSRAEEAETETVGRQSWSFKRFKSDRLRVRESRRRLLMGRKDSVAPEWASEEGSSDGEVAMFVDQREGSIDSRIDFGMLRVCLQDGQVEAKEEVKGNESEGGSPVPVEETTKTAVCFSIESREPHDAQLRVVNAQPGEKAYLEPRAPMEEMVDESVDRTSNESQPQRSSLRVVNALLSEDGYSPRSITPPQAGEDAFSPPEPNPKPETVPPRHERFHHLHLAAQDLDLANRRTLCQRRFRVCNVDNRLRALERHDELLRLAEDGHGLSSGWCAIKSWRASFVSLREGLNELLSAGNLIDFESFMMWMMDLEQWARTLEYAVPTL